MKWSDETPKLWLSFLDRIFAGNQSLIGFIQRLMGSSLVGEQLDHVLPIFWGKSRNGKSVLVSTWLGMMGEYATKGPQTRLLATNHKQHPTELAKLHGKRFVAVSEADDGCRLSEALVKDLTGGETITARRLRDQPAGTNLFTFNHAGMGWPASKRSTTG